MIGWAMMADAEPTKAAKGQQEKAGELRGNARRPCPEALKCRLESGNMAHKSIQCHQTLPTCAPEWLPELITDDTALARYSRDVLMPLLDIARVHLIHLRISCPDCQPIDSTFSQRIRLPSITSLRMHAQSSESIDATYPSACSLKATLLHARSKPMASLRRLTAMVPCVRRHQHFQSLQDKNSRRNVPRE